MRYVFLIAIIAVTATGALAQDTHHRMPEKTGGVAPPHMPDSDRSRQGGDTISDAMVITVLPYGSTGTTAGYNDDYDESCPYTQSTSPDVVYAYTPDADVLVDIDLCDSSYDTKLYVYDAELEIVACNDDAYFSPPCGRYVSALEDVLLAAGTTYYVVIDGYGGDFGDYVFEMGVHVPCVLDCPPDGFAEGEPPLEDDYLDAHNGGCNSPEFGVPFQELHGDENGELVFCGKSGWYQFHGSNNRDTDWIVVYAGDSGVVEVTGDAEHPTYLFEMGVQDCSSLGVIQNITVGECTEASMTMSYDNYDDHSMWFWAGPTTFTAPDGSHTYEFDYVVFFSGLATGTVARERTSWSGVKGLFR